MPPNKEWGEKNAGDVGEWLVVFCGITRDILRLTIREGELERGSLAGQTLYFPRESGLRD